jgi:lipopolysaccharide transport system ATP-binding protein
MKPIIRVDRLSKQYQIGKREAYKTLRETLVEKATAPLGALRTLFKGTNGRHPREDNTHWALKDVSFEVMPGEVVGIIGRNGAGKSTLLKILSRITEPTTGQAELYGRVGSLLEVGTGFHAELTGRENIYLNGAILGMKRAEIQRKFDEIVAFAEVEQFLDTPVKHYSSGMYMRLAFAVAAHLEPEILVVDEVLAVGDATFQKKCLGKMEDVARQGRTVLFVSHNMNAIQQLCDRAILLNGGRVQGMSADVHKLTREYFALSAGQAAPSEWVNPGGHFQNPYFHPLRFAVCDGDGAAVGMPARNDAELWIMLEADVEILDPALTIGYALYAESDEVLYWSYQTDTEQGRWPSLQRGRVRLRSRLPRRILNEGTYRLELIGGLHCRKWLFRPRVNAPSLLMSIQGGLSDSPNWMGRRDGLLAPVLEWESMP